MLYSFKTALPQKLPSEFLECSLRELNDIGFVKVPDKPQAEPGYFVDWTGTEWITRPANTTEISFKWQEIRDTRRALLEYADIEVMKYVEKNQQVPDDLSAYKQALRDITLQENPWFITWPTYK